MIDLEFKTQSESNQFIPKKATHEITLINISQIATGNGTHENPYSIENFNFINSTTQTPIFFDIFNSKAFINFINCQINYFNYRDDFDSSSVYIIKIRNSSNISFINCHFATYVRTLWIENSTKVQITRSSFEGSNFNDNSIGVYILMQSKNIYINNCLFTNHKFPLYLSKSENFLFTNCTISKSLLGFRIRHSLNITILNNTFCNNNFIALDSEYEFKII